MIITHGVTSRFLRTAALGLSLAELDRVPGGQGVVLRLRDGLHEVLIPNDLQVAAAAGRAAV